ncbi:protein phosphatase [Sulfolobus sp. A20]|uniref:protein-tyrosine phosphatase family protein n=1 Tax=Sulfolobaceae TaxID=118883 RepID=UPI000845C890|nr:MULTISPECIES: dual specificity protein phosphatase family protein [unclassified Sulfolobus]TRM73626.1 protein phosphatase [Sulfolobus sp. E5]TRM78222.1 protein phosphatase [Sulfolobus sp. B5]TRM78380.1 protein phosphatase [Sulfolobus sp. A20-N-F8]TRM83636.1 protein phosphatase [Sulfolobus sp. A20-N-F6]TRM85377.1 protein phosphatase [Sulfolobus sp. F3]TRM85936.1 protein phosphatase [Sulfolobus sp. E3]TRM89088.1 protein phosphatase [Sulfolobus sp. C3]TRM94524.1 protein phosphatase [Sulfolo
MYWVRERVIGGSPIPYNEYEIEEWKRQGVKRVLVLPEDWEIEEAWGDKEYYFDVLRSKGLEYIHVPITDGEAPTDDQFLIIMRWLNSKKVGNLVHCVGGIGRTGTILASYLILFEGLDLEEALDEVRRVRPGAVQTYQQEMFLLRIEGMRKNWLNLIYSNS